MQNIKAVVKGSFLGFEDFIYNKGTSTQKTYYALILLQGTSICKLSFGDFSVSDFMTKHKINDNLIIDAEISDKDKPGLKCKFMQLTLV